MAGFTYNPTNYELPKLNKISPVSPAPTTKINNNVAKSILDNFASKFSTPVAYSSRNNIQDIGRPTQELGRQFIQQNLLPEFQQNVYNPFQRQLANRSASSNLGLLGGAKRYAQDQTRQVVQPFNDQAMQVQDTFNQLAQDRINETLKDYYNSQLTF